MPRVGMSLFLHSNSRISELTDFRETLYGLYPAGSRPHPVLFLSPL
jgi:hypothetical protein